MENLENLISYTMDQTPIDFENAFNDLIINRLRTAIEDKKISIAKQMYGYTEPESEE